MDGNNSMEYLLHSLLASTNMAERFLEQISVIF
jgi:hypothetical protein